MKKRFRAIVTGRVQMVMFRDFTARNARKLDLAGEVRNLSDGSVEVIAEGDAAKLEVLLDQVRKGPTLASVEDVVVEWSEPEGGFEDFRIAYD
ncbi:MAG TPA: acylphosphatase [Candidatus Paceibacterota bacterium]|nr:acylphosphatase [Candidatus Paceibacterota bacterium]